MRIQISKGLFEELERRSDELFKSRVCRIHDAWETLFEEKEETRQLELFGNNGTENE